MSSSSGRFSRFPAVNRDVAPSIRIDQLEGLVTAESVDGDVIEVQGVEVVVTEQSDVTEVKPVVPEVQEIQVPDLNAPELIEWFGKNKKRRAAALEAELKGKNRKGVLLELGHKVD